MLKCLPTEYFVDRLQRGVQSATTDGLPICKHVVFDHNIELVNIFQGDFAIFARIVNQVMEGTTLEIIGVCLDPTTVRW